jgi:hypothetical protein
MPLRGGTLIALPLFYLCSSVAIKSAVSFFVPIHLWPFSCLMEGSTTSKRTPLSHRLIDFSFPPSYPYSSVFICGN